MNGTQDAVDLATRIIAVVDEPQILGGERLALQRQHRHHAAPVRRHRMPTSSSRTPIWRCIGRRRTAATSIRFYASDMNTRALEAAALDSALREAIEQRAVHPVLPAAGRHPVGAGGRRRGAAALAQARAAASSAPRRVPGAGGGERPDRADQRMGAARGLPRSEDVATRRRPAAARRRQSVADPVPQAERSAARDQDPAARPVSSRACSIWS